MNADGSGLHVLSRFEGYTLPPVWSPAWSPDGQAIAFTVRTVARSGAASEPPSVFYVTADGTVGLLIENASSPSWHK
jgi:Tol biopolymer transport system component